MTHRLRATVITVSDEVASGRDDDRGGPLARELLTELGLDVDRRVVGDDDAQLERAAGRQGARLAR